MLSLRLSYNIRFFASQFFNISGVDSFNCRNVSTKRDDSNEIAGSLSLEDIEDEESIRAMEAAIEKKRNKSELFQSDYNRQHDRMPFETPQWEYHETLNYRRRMYGKYGESSNVDPSILWPSKIELAAMKDYEKVAQPFTLDELIEKVRVKKALAEEKILNEERKILEKVGRVKQEIVEFHKRVAIEKQKALEIVQHKNRLIEQVKRHFGYEMNPHDERFKEMLEKLQKEEKKKLKKERRTKYEDKTKLSLEFGTPGQDKESDKELN